MALNLIPDVSFATNRVAKYAANPKLNYLSDVKLKYIKRSNDFKLKCLSDASFAHSNTDFRLITSMVCYLNNDLFYRPTKRQTKVARSTFIAELFSLVYGTDTLMQYKKICEVI
uniref:DDE_Tnp_1_7 domain-containing protein n=1 Tax=Strongyloides venezuelensis TaxID=75913 RepID=A0A0K0FTE7_STRVS